MNIREVPNLTVLDENVDIVIPLNDAKQVPYAEKYNPTKDYGEALVISFSLLKKINFSLKNKNISVLPLSSLIKTHTAALSDLYLKNMNECGRGAFVKEQLKGSFAYSGRYLEKDEREVEEKTTVIYGIEITKKSTSLNLLVDGYFGMGGCLQHLPRTNPLSETKQDIALQNVTSSEVFICITVNDIQYFLPVRCFFSLAKNTIIGFDYGEEYWINLHKLPRFFSSQGKIIGKQKEITLLIRTEETDASSISYRFNSIDFKKLLKDQYLECEDKIMILSDQSLKFLNKKSNRGENIEACHGFSIPNIYISHMCPVAINDALGLAFKIINITDEKLDNICEENKELIYGITEKDNDSYLLFNIKKITAAPIEQIQVLSIILGENILKVISRWLNLSSKNGLLTDCTDAIASLPTVFPRADMECKNQKKLAFKYRLFSNSDSANESAIPETEKLRPIFDINNRY